MTRLVSTENCKGIFAPPIRLITFPSTIGKNRVCTNVSGSRVYTYTSTANLIKGANCFQLIFKVAFVEAYLSVLHVNSFPLAFTKMNGRTSTTLGKQNYRRRTMVSTANRKPVFKPLFQFHGLSHSLSSRSRLL